MPNTHSKVILLAVPGDEAAGGWPVPFDETVVGDAMTLAGRYDAIVQADHLTRPPLARPGTRLGFLVGEVIAPGVPASTRDLEFCTVVCAGRARTPHRE